MTKSLADSAIAKQSGPIVTAGSNVALLLVLLKFSSLISRPMQDAVAMPNDLGINEVKVILCLGGDGPQAGHDLTDLLGVAPMNISRALALLKARGWIEEVVDPANRRRKPVQLSAEGWAGYRAIMPDVAIVADYLLARLTAAERSSLARIAGKVTGRMERWPLDQAGGIRTELALER